MTPKNNFNIKNYALCASCIGEAYLRQLVEDEGENRICSYCNQIGQTFMVVEISKRVEAAFDEHFVRTSCEPSELEYAQLKDKELKFDWEREGQSTVYAIMDAADIPENAAKHVQEILADSHYDYDKAKLGEETDYSEEAHYTEIMPGDEEWQKEWNDFERDIKTESRFFSRVAAEQLSMVFGRIEQMRTTQNHPLIIDAGPSEDLSHFYRARVFQSDENLKKALARPDLELCAPPTGFAPAGRMNASGISVFYGSTEIQTALAEVRPPVGSQVVLARFDIIRPIRLLDLTALGDVHEYGSIFDENYASRLSHMTFLRSLSTRISRPVMPDDRESEYLPTQAIADFLASEVKINLDGILFPSVQLNTTGLNVVLFHKAAKCEEIQIPEDAEFDVCTNRVDEDEIERYYQVTETVPEEKPNSCKKQSSELFYPTYLDLIDWTNYDARDVTLRVNLDSMRVHVVDATRIETSDYAVERFRWTKDETTLVATLGQLSTPPPI